MAKCLAEMVAYPTLRVPRLGDIAAADALGAVSVFENGVARSDAEPWGGGPFGFQIDILESVPEDADYTPLRQPNVVTWYEDAEPRTLRSVDELVTAHDADKVTIEPTGLVVTAPVVGYPSDPFPTSHGRTGRVNSADSTVLGRR